jgi:hypothetical protein
MVLCITCQAASTESLGCMTSKFKLHLRVVHLVSIILFCHKNRARFLTNTDMYPKPRLFRVDFAHPTPDDGLGIPNSREITYGSGQRHLDCGPQTIFVSAAGACASLKSWHPSVLLYQVRFNQILQRYFQEYRYSFLGSIVVARF